MSKNAKRPVETTKARGVGSSHETLTKKEDDQTIKIAYSTEYRDLAVWPIRWDKIANMGICTIYWGSLNVRHAQIHNRRQRYAHTTCQTFDFFVFIQRLSWYNDQDIEQTGLVQAGSVVVYPSCSVC